MTDIGIVVVTWNTLDFLKPMVKSIRSRYNTRVIVVDNNSIDGTDEWVKARMDEAPDKWSFIKFTEAGSMGRNRNAGIKLAYALGCSHIVLTQEDLLLHKDCLDSLVDAHDNKGFLIPCGWSIQPYDVPEAWNRIAALVVVKLGSDIFLKTHLVDAVTGQPVHPARLFGNYRWMDQSVMDTILSLSDEVQAALDSYTPAEVYATGFPVVCLMGRKEVETVGYYDGGFSEAVYDDADLMYRASKVAGYWEIKWGVQRALYYHWGGGSHYNNRIPWWNKMQKVMEDSEQRYIKKWGGKILSETYKEPIPQPDLWESPYSYIKGDE